MLIFVKTCVVQEKNITIDCYFFNGCSLVIVVVIIKCALLDTVHRIWCVPK